MKINKFLPLLALPIIALMFCHKLEDNQPNTIIELYKGQTVYREDRMSNGVAYHFDTIYDDSYTVVKLEDSITFINTTATWKFKFDSIHPNYIHYYHLHSQQQYFIRKDSLFVDFSEWGGGGFGGNFNSKKRNFSGLKQ